MVRVPRVTPGYGLQERLAGLEERGLRRRPATVHSRAGAEVCLETGAALNFCSNDYLGLAGHPRLVKAWQDGAANFGVGATASPLVCGRHAVHAELERELARQTGRERALLFPSGFQANLAVITALAAGRPARPPDPGVVAMARQDLHGSGSWSSTRACAVNMVPACTWTKPTPSASWANTDAALWKPWPWARTTYQS
ncbi:MAG: aminotransferase class I/II-fold pyridoxal phosphate-dependent enzyme [Gammaproteobacteria bacterium]